MIFDEGLAQLQFGLLDTLMQLARMPLLGLAFIMPGYSAECIITTTTRLAEVY